MEQFKLNVQMSMRTLSGLNERVNELEEHDENHEERLKELENITKELQNKMLFMKPSEGDGFDADAFSKLLEQYANKDDMESLKERVEKLEKELDEFKDKSKKKLKKHKKQLKDHDEDIEKLKKIKVDNDTFDSEINFIKNILNKHSGDKIDLSSMGP